MQRAVRRDGFKRIDYHINGVHTTQLFDLEQDPHETRNLADDPAHRETLNRLGRIKTTEGASGSPDECGA
ncbi:MAG: hypothetical protein JJT96_05995 [Opitutales bacterium]|nr:hypothetical protein [Opitutales bacterium]